MHTSGKYKDIIQTRENNRIGFVKINCFFFTGLMQILELVPKLLQWFKYVCAEESTFCHEWNLG